MQCKLVVIGGGPAGMAAAVAAAEAGVTDILLIERDEMLGGVLNQCVHNGFGLLRFGESLTGPEYAEKMADCVAAHPIRVMTSTMVLSITRERTVTAMNSELGVFTVEAGAIVLAMGCRERSRGALNIPGNRPAGIYSAGTAQRYVNMEGYLPGRDVVILGSGDIGLIMARRMTLEGARVHAVCELMSVSSGLRRNIVQCLDDFDIPLYLDHTITAIEGRERVEAVTISRVDPATRLPIKGTERRIPCDTVLFSVGLIPENELTVRAGIAISPRTRGAVVDQDRATEAEGIFAAGNVLHVHDLADYAAEEAEEAGRAAARYLENGPRAVSATLTLSAGQGVGYVVPQRITLPADGVRVYFRVSAPLAEPRFTVRCGDRVLLSRKKLAAMPGEMESLTLTAEMLKDAEGEITVSAEEIRK